MKANLIRSNLKANFWLFMVVAQISQISCKNIQGNSIKSVKLDKIIDISSDMACSCALRRSGIVHCWGDCTMDSVIDLQITNETSQNPPKFTSSNLDAQNFKVKPFVALHIPGTSRISVESWGGFYIQNGNLWEKEYWGICEGRCSDEPILIREGVQDVSASGPCFVSEGEVFCYGVNYHGQVGIGTDSRYVKEFTRLNISNIKVIQSSMSNACAIDFQGNLYCWGSNQNCQISPKSQSKFPSPYLVASHISHVAISEEQICAIRSSGVVQCWGIPKTPEPSSSGIDIPSNGSAQQPWILEPMEKIFAGMYHFCAISTLGSVYCWGWNGSGQVSPERDVLVTKPKKINLPSRATSLALSWLHSCALLETGEVFCWGSSSLGQFGSIIGGEFIPPTMVIK